MVKTMSRASIERRLRSTSKQLQSLREELRVSEEQLIQLADEADDARLRALVSETPGADKEHRKASRHAERLRDHRDRAAAKIAELEATQDELLDRLSSS
jgi:flagellar biosynthesis chaperone FliJ